jgi:hypothetical protein
VVGYSKGTGSFIANDKILFKTLGSLGMWSHEVGGKKVIRYRKEDAEAYSAGSCSDSGITELGPRTLYEPHVRKEHIFEWCECLSLLRVWQPNHLGPSWEIQGHRVRVTLPPQISVA